MPWLWAFVWFTLPVSLKASSVSLIVFGTGTLIQCFYEKPAVSRKQVVLFILFILFFAWHATGLLFDPAKHEVWKSLERKLSFIAIPLIMLLVTGARWNLEKWAIRGFFAGLAVTGIHMLALAIWHLIMGRTLEAVTYHEFTRPYTLGAIYYSWYLSAALYYLTFCSTEKILDRFRPVIGIFFIILLLFSASKLFILLTIPAVIWPLIKKYINRNNKKRYLVPVILLIMIILGSVPFISRLSDLKNTDLKIVGQHKFTYDSPFNGITFRLVLWRFAGEMMSENRSWITGVGIGSRQEILNEHYVKYGIYTGNPDLGDRGYLGYNFHNQYLEILTGTGVPGLILLLSIIIYIFTVKRVKLLFPFLVYIIVIVFFLTESVLERQTGIVFFCLIWTLRVNVPANMKSVYGNITDH